MPTIDLPITPDGAIITICIQLSIPKMAALSAAGQKIPSPFLGRGLIDTGASSTAIDRTVVQALGLTPTGTVAIHTPSTGTQAHTCNQYDVSVWFANIVAPVHPQVQAQPQVQVHPITFTLPVIEADFSAQAIHALIGRDLLNRCQFTYNVAAGRFSLAY